MCAWNSVFTYLEQTHAFGTCLAHHLLELLAHDHYTGCLPSRQSARTLTSSLTTRTLGTDPANTLITQLTLECFAAVSQTINQRVKLSTFVLHLQCLACEILEVDSHGLQLVLESSDA